jgi:FkbM family methyltransferase
LTDFSDQVRLRFEVVEGVSPWVWPNEDYGAWIGPSEEFASIRDNILPFTKQRRLIVTAGGCCGMYPRLWSEVFETVYTFEPTPISYYCLLQNCPDERIRKFNAALGEYDKKVWLQADNKTNVGSNRISIDDGHCIEVDQVTVDSLNLPYCDVLQFDIEGYEPSALLGAAGTIQKFRPVICLETKNVQDGSHIILTGWGYQVASGTRNDTIFIPIP